jgi:hypothetical protein
MKILQLRTPARRLIAADDVRTNGFIEYWRFSFCILQSEVVVQNPGMGP